MKLPQEILTTAIKEWNPIRIVCLFSGGYDSMCATHLTHRLDTHGVPISTWAIDTKLSADGWREYVQVVADELQFSNFNIWDNEKGFRQFVESVRQKGCPRTRAMHTYVFQKLKERGIDGIHMLYKQQRSDKTLFISGMRRAESVYRQNADEVSRVGNSNKIFAAPIVYWSDEDIARYRMNNDLPDNPFYDTVKGSGDCQCNWGNFITLGTLRIYSPNLAAGNVALIDQLSKDLHGYGWDGSPASEPLFDIEEYWDTGELTSPFLCSNCSRIGTHRHKAAEEVMLQRGML